MLAVAMRPLTLCFTASHRESSFAAALSLLGGGIFPATTLRVTLFVGVAAATLVAAGMAFAQVQTAAPGKRRALPLTKFYDTPHPLPAGKPGELIRSEPFEEYEIPLSVSAVRILYHSRSAAGDDVAASGVVLIPYEKKPPAGGWPILAWAHGATGVARSCAPSLMRNIGHGPFLSMYVNLGYAVVATDYAGLEPVSGMHFWMVRLARPMSSIPFRRPVRRCRSWARDGLSWEKRTEV